VAILRHDDDVAFPGQSCADVGNALLGSVPPTAAIEEDDDRVFATILGPIDVGQIGSARPIRDVPLQFG
jgi:hypothetical protein